MSKISALLVVIFSLLQIENIGLARSKSKSQSRNEKSVKKSDGFENPLSVARRHMQRKEYKKAQDILRKLAEKNKSTELYLLSGEVAFHLKKYAVARKLFDKVPPIMLKNASAYAYGYAHLKNKNWREAIKGFKKVGKKNRYRGLAGYYIGFCYFRLAEFDGARKYLRRVDFSKLPKKLQIKRDQLLQLVEKKSDEQARAILDVAKDDSKPNLSEGIDVDDLLLPTYAEAGESEDTSSSGRFYKIKGLVTHQQLSRKLENHGYVNLNLNVGATKVFGEISSVFFRSSNSKLKPGIQGGAGYSNLTVTADEAAFVTLSETTGAFAQLQTERQAERFAILKAQPFLNYAITDKQKLQLSVLALQYLSQKDGLDNWSVLVAKAFYDIKLEDLKANASFSQRQRQDDAVGGDTSETVINGLFSYRYNFARLNLNLKNIARSGAIYIDESPFRGLLLDKEVDPMDGYAGITFFSAASEFSYEMIDAIFSFKQISRTSPTFIPRQSSIDLADRHAEGVSELGASVRVRLFGSLSLSGQVYQSTISSTVEEVELNDGAVRTFQSDVDQLGGGFSAVFAPFDWLKLNGSYGVSKNTYVPVNFGQDEDFYKSVPDFISYTLIQAKVSYEF